MKKTFIHNVCALQPGEGMVAGSLLLADGKIKELDPPASVKEDCDFLFDGQGRLLTPGLIDIHTHGIREFSYERSVEDLENGLKCLPKFGTTCVLPTLYKTLCAGHEDALRELSGFSVSPDAARVPGFHMEGPFLALPGAGSMTLSGDVEFLEQLIDAVGGRVSAMSVSPDTENIIPVIERLVEMGIVPFVTHTRASPEQTEAAIEAGACHATHFYDVFLLPDDKNPGVRPVGVVETMLGDKRCSVDFVCDGVHVHPAAIRCALAAKGFKKVMVITDSNIGAGLPPGTYDTPFGHPIKTEPGNGARICSPGHPLNGALAGSALTMPEGMSNMFHWLDLDSAGVWAMGTRNQASLLGLGGKGVIRPDADADLVIWDQESGLNAAATWIAGRLVYHTCPS